MEPQSESEPEVAPEVFYLSHGQNTRGFESLSIESSTKCGKNVGVLPIIQILVGWDAVKSIGLGVVKELGRIKKILNCKNLGLVAIGG